MTTALRLLTAGTTVEVADLTGRHVVPLAHSAGTVPDGASADPTRIGRAEVRVVLEPGRRPFDREGAVPVTRGAWARGDTVVLEDVGGSGHTQEWQVTGDGLRIRSRWTPGLLERGASAVRSRHDALRAQVLLHYPALWWAGVQGRTPLHVSVVEIEGVGVVLAGPGGVGKSTLVADALAEGARATADNIAVTDGTTMSGLRESLRLAPGDGAGGSGSHTTHGRRQQGWPAVASLRPELVVVLRRGTGPRVRQVRADDARRALVAGTYAAGELRRFWPLTAVLGLATGRGPVHPHVEDTARRLSEELPCVELELGRPGLSLREALAAPLDDVRSARTSR